MRIKSENKWARRERITYILLKSSACREKLQKRNFSVLLLLAEAGFDEISRNDLLSRLLYFYLLCIQKQYGEIVRNEHFKGLV